MDEGPIIEQRPGKVTVRYDAKDEGGDRIPDDRRHLLIYFDHYVCPDVVAHGARVDRT